MYKLLSAAAFFAGSLFLASSPAMAGPSTINPKCYFYVEPNFTGAFLTMRKAEALDFVGNQFNDKISSVKCETGCTATGYTAIGFMGKYRTFKGNTRSLTELWDNKISSLRVNCVPQRRPGTPPVRPVFPG